MPLDAIYISGKRREHGYEMEFTLKKIIELRDVEYLVLLDTDGNHYLVPHNFYTHYKFAIGQNIKGWIDKINCTGRIFIEPYHPVYKVGEKYKFKIKHVSGHNFCVVDALDCEWTLQGQAFGKAEDTIELLVKKIKKGKLYLEQLP